VVAVRGSPVEDYCRAPTGGLTTRYHGYTITGKSDEGQDASLRIEMGNPKLNGWSQYRGISQPEKYWAPPLRSAMWDPA